MGLINKLLKAKIPQLSFTPDFELSEYDNWLNFLDAGGSKKEWEILKKENNWDFAEDETEVFLQHQNGIKPISDKYYSQLEAIQENWSIMYNLKKYTGKHADKFEQMCLDNILLYKQKTAIERKHGDTTPQNAPAFKRLAMLYEKQEDFEKSVAVCINALNNGAYGDGMRNRLSRMIKKAGREPTIEELSLLDKYE